MRLTAHQNNLRVFLEELILQADVEAHVQADPVGVVRPLPREDQEVGAFITSCVAYGRADLLRRASSELLAKIGPGITSVLRDASFDEIRELAEGFDYRMTKEEDIADLLWAIGNALREHGTLEGLYLASGETHLERASGFVTSLRARRFRTEEVRGFRYLLPDPAAGSATKRLHLFFRWVIRPDDGVDLGLWTDASTSDLLMPLDTHTSRIARYLGLSARKTVDLTMSKQVTRVLALLDPDDPVRYDFAICHLGISGSCIHKRSEEHCPRCPLDGVCELQ